MGRMQQHILKLYDFWWQLGSNHTIRFCTKAGTNYRGRINFWRTGKHGWSCAWPTSKYHSKKNHQDLFQNQNSKNSAMRCTIHPQLNPNKSPFFMVIPHQKHRSLSRLPHPAGGPWGPAQRRADVAGGGDFMGIWWENLMGSKLWPFISYNWV